MTASVSSTVPLTRVVSWGDNDGDTTPNEANMSQSTRIDASVETTLVTHQQPPPLPEINLDTKVAQNGDNANTTITRTDAARSSDKVKASVRAAAAGGSTFATSTEDEQHDAQWKQTMERIQTIKQEMALLSRAVKNTVDVMASYRSTQAGKHDGWMLKLSQLETTCEQLMQQWTSAHREKVHRAIIIHDEVVRDMAGLHNKLHTILQRDAERIEYEWNAAQRRDISQWEDDQADLMKRRKLLSDRLLHWERHITTIPGTESILACIQQANEVQRGLDESYVRWTALHEFENAYQHIVQLWRILYSQTKKTDVRLTPDILRRL